MFSLCWCVVCSRSVGCRGVCGVLLNLFCIVVIGCVGVPGLTWLILVLRLLTGGWLFSM